MSPYVIIQFMSLGGVFVVAAWLAIWSRRQTPARHAAMLVLVAGLASLAVAGIETSGFPKPMRWAWELTGDYRVLGTKMVQDDGIYLFVDTGEATPRSYKLPWSNSTASRIQALIEKGRKGQYLMKFEWSWDRHKPQFRALPQPMIPLPKQAPSPVPRFEQGA